MNIHLAMPATVVLVWTSAFSTVHAADRWPQPKVVEYFNSCVTIHEHRWRGLPEVIVTRLCNCKMSILQRKSFDFFVKAEKEINSESLEKYVALSEASRISVFDGANDDVKTVMFLVGMAEEECAPR